MRPIEQTGVGTDDCIRKRLPSADEGELVNTRIRAVQNAKPVQAIGNIQLRLRREVYHDSVAELTHHRLLHRIAGIGQLPSAVELLVLNQERQLGYSLLKLQRLAQRLLILVFDHENTRQAMISLLGGEIMRMRVVPVHAPAIGHPECVVIVRSGGNCCARMTVHHRWQMQAVPMDDRRLVQIVLQAGVKLAAALHANSRVLKNPVTVFCVVDQKGRLLVLNQRKRGGTGIECEPRVGNIEYAEGAAIGRNKQGAVASRRCAWKVILAGVRLEAVQISDPEYAKPGCYGILNKISSFHDDFSV